ncbi:MAG: AAA family ATPase [Candidatus Heimdallarchaeaceae archaeon]
MDILDEIMKGMESKEEKEEKENIERSDIDEDITFSDKDIENWLLRPVSLNKKFCMLIYGVDGTGKSGLALSYPLKKNEKMVVLDLDGGCDVLLVKYHKDKLKKGQIFCQNPLEIKRNVVEGKEIVTIDYSMTMNRVRSVTKYIAKKYRNCNIAVLVIDGLSKLLKHAEYQMRIEKNLTAEGDVSYRYWKRRNQLFLEILEIAKALPIDLILIAHDDFIILDSDEEIAMVKRETNRLVWQKIRCVRNNLPDKVEYRAIVDKSKYDTSAEGKEITFLTIDKESGNYVWKGEKIFKILSGEETKEDN